MSARKSATPSPVPARLLRNLLGTSSAPKIKVLDVGCGDGSVVRALRSLGAEAVGIDDALTAPAEGLTAGSLAANLAYPAHSFDVILVRGMKVYGQPAGSSCSSRRSLVDRWLPMRAASTTGVNISPGFPERAKSVSSVTASDFSWVSSGSSARSGSRRRSSR